MNGFIMSNYILSASTDVEYQEDGLLMVALCAARE